MISHSLYYTSDKVYRTILNRIASLGYNVKRMDENKKEIEVWRRFFPFIKRTFSITVIKTSDSVCSFSVVENGSVRFSGKHEKNLETLISHFF